MFIQTFSVNLYLRYLLPRSSWGRKFSQGCLRRTKQTDLLFVHVIDHSARVSRGTYVRRKLVIACSEIVNQRVSLLSMGFSAANAVHVRHDLFQIRTNHHWLTYFYPGSTRNGRRGGQLTSSDITRFCCVLFKFEIHTGTYTPT